MSFIAVCYDTDSHCNEMDGVLVCMCNMSSVMYESCCCCKILISG